MRRIYEYICIVEVFVIKVFIFIFSGLIFSAAVSRYLGYPINWSVDLALCLFAWCTFIGGDVALRKNKLLNVDFFVKKLSEKGRESMEVINLLIILVFLMAVVIYGIKISYITRFRSFQGIPWFSYTWVTLSMPVGGMLMTITVTLKLRERIKFLKSMWRS